MMREEISLSKERFDQLIKDAKNVPEFRKRTEAAKKYEPKDLETPEERFALEKTNAEQDASTIASDLRIKYLPGQCGGYLISSSPTFVNKVVEDEATRRTPNELSNKIEEISDIFSKDQQIKLIIEQTKEQNVKQRSESGVISMRTVNEKFVRNEFFI